RHLPRLGRFHERTARHRISAVDGRGGLGTLMTVATVDYPAHFESDVVLRNGRTLHIRPVRPDDGPLLLAFYRALSADSLYMRFFDMRSAEGALRDSPTDVDYETDFGVVAE